MKAVMWSWQKGRKTSHSGPARYQIKPLWHRAFISSGMILHLRQLRTPTLPVPYLWGKGCDWRGLFYSPKYFMSEIKWKQLPKSWPPWSSIRAFCWISTTGRRCLRKDRSQLEILMPLWKIGLHPVCSAQRRQFPGRKLLSIRSRIQAYTHLPEHTYVYIHKDRKRIYTPA